MIESVDLLNPVVVAIYNKLPLIITCLFAIPLGIFAVVSALKFVKSKAAHKSDLTEPLLQKKSRESKIKQSIVVKDKTLQMNFLKCRSSENLESLHSEPMIIKENLEQIAISANWVDGALGLMLVRGKKDKIEQHIFGLFDHSLNQTDRVLTQDHKIVKKAKPGDQLFVIGAESYIFNLRVDLLEKEEESRPLWTYKCSDGHALQVFYGDGKECDKVNAEWAKLTDGKSEHKCGHQKKFTQKNKNGYDKALLQYYCYDCEASFCAKCALEFRIPNK